MKRHNTLHLLFNHTLTDAQHRDAYESLGIGTIRYLPEALLDIWRNIPPHTQSLKALLAPIYEYINQTCKEGDYILIQGDFGASYLVVNHAFSLNLIPLYATTQRKSVEKIEEGKIIKTSVFEHGIFRRYEE